MTKMKKTDKNTNNIERSVYACVAIGQDGFEVQIADKRNKKILDESITVNKKDLDKKIFAWLYKYQARENIKIIAIKIITEQKDGRRQLSSDLWLKQDIVPYVIHISKGTTKQKIQQAIIDLTRHFNGHDIVDVQFEPHRQVHVDRLASIEDIEKQASKENWKLLLELTKLYRQKDGKMLFFSSTPRGGGVALMRHALIRLYRQLNLDARWYVLSSKKEAFNVTKKKFHNVQNGYIKLCWPQVLQFSL